MQIVVNCQVVSQFNRLITEMKNKTIFYLALIKIILLNSGCTSVKTIEVTAISDQPARFEVNSLIVCSDVTECKFPVKCTKKRRAIIGGKFLSAPYRVIATTAGARDEKTIDACDLVGRKKGDPSIMNFRLHSDSSQAPEPP